ncbi:hypothetical protein [Pseudoalteromonas rubra]|uniref:Uncharacterized protein n=1 Tax=Pseudoalteromonas rubra TaxID=43658 RepID=A0A0F4QU89_9GAMM|nr:hypothetical protein [Pseudoalteromonas rubra]KJZ10182.1 hypothetical protein TW77_08110 [Pseudoalteromonas rubra]
MSSFVAVMGCVSGLVKGSLMATRSCGGCIYGMVIFMSGNKGGVVSYIQVYMSVMLFAFLVCFVVTLFKRQAQRPKFEQNAQATKDENKKPTIMHGL